MPVAPMRASWKPAIEYTLNRWYILVIMHYAIDTKYTASSHTTRYFITSQILESYHMYDHNLLPLVLNWWITGIEWVGKVTILFNFRGVFLVFFLGGGGGGGWGWGVWGVEILALRWRHNDHAGVSNHQPHGCLPNRLFRRKSKKTSKLRVTGLCAGNSPGTGEFPAQMASYAENVSIWWRHHERRTMFKQFVIRTWSLQTPTYFDWSLSESMMTSSNGNIFRVTGPLCGKFTGRRWIPRTKASDAELLCFLLLTWISFYSSIDKLSHPLQSVWWNYVSISKLQWCKLWSLGMNKWSHPTICWACDYSFMLELWQLIHVSKKGPWRQAWVLANPLHHVRYFRRMWHLLDINTMILFLHVMYMIYVYIWYIIFCKNNNVATSQCLLWRNLRTGRS